MQEDHRLEAPLNDRPSTPGVGASLPPVDSVDTDKDKNCDQVKTKKEIVTAKVNVEGIKEDSSLEDTSKKDTTKKDTCKKDARTEYVKKPVTVSPPSNTKVDKKPQALDPKESAKADKVKQAIIAEEMKPIKSPIKILKNSEGHYEVLRPSSDKQTSPEARNNSSEKKSHNPEFSVISIGQGPNSNGVKITLKQCSPGTASSKAKIVSNVVLRNGQSEKALKPQEKSHQKDVVDKQEKHKRKVSFEDKVILKEPDNEAKNVNISLTEQSDKKQFLQGFMLTAIQPGSVKSSPDKNAKGINKPIPVLNALPKVTDNTLSKSPTNSDKCEIKKDEQKNNHINSDTINSTKEKNSEKTSTILLKGDNSKSPSKRLFNGVTKDLSTNDNDSKVDVYAFPSEPPTVPTGAVKRKCPPGLPIFEVDRKRPFLQGQIRKKGQPTSLNSPKGSKKQDIVSSPKKLQSSKDNSPTGVNRAAPQNTISSRPPAATISDNTRNLLDGCGLNIPASLSITLTAPKSPSHSSSSTDTNNLKDNQILSGKVNPSITLNDRSVDPRVLKALKTGQIRMPVPTSRPKAKAAPDRSQPTKRKRDDSRDALDLSGSRKLDIHPLRIPQPISKFKSKPTRESASTHPASSQVVTLTGGQKYYRAPPGSLTPAVHRVAEYSQPPPSRAPVYAPSCFSSPLDSNRSSNNISSVFPSLQSLYALSQAPNLQQFQMDNRLRLPQPENTTPSGPGKSHLAAQCAPLKPARSSYASLAVPLVKQSPSVRPVSLSAGIARANELIKNKGINKGEIQAKRENLQNSSIEKRLPLLINSNTSKDAEKISRSSSSPMSPHSKQLASTVNISESNLHEAASPRVSSTVSPSPPPSHPPRTSSANNNPTNADEVSSESNCNKLGPEVTSSKSPESPDSSSVVSELLNNASGRPVEDKPQPSPKEDKLDSQKEMEKQPELPVKSSDISSKTGDKKTDNIKVNAKQMTSEVFQKRLLAAFPSNEWANNPIAAKHLGNLLKSLTTMQTNNQTENVKKVKSDNSCEKMPAKCLEDISPKAKAEVTD